MSKSVAAAGAGSRGLPQPQRDGLAGAGRAGAQLSLGRRGDDPSRDLSVHPARALRARFEMSHRFSFAQDLPKPCTLRAPTVISARIDRIRAEITVMGKSRGGVWFQTRSSIACG